MAIYTKRGDKGETSLYVKSSTQGDRVTKDSLIIQTIGALDELNSYLGIVISSSEDPVLIDRLKEVQRNLFVIGSILAGSKLRFFKTRTRKLEKVIDELEGKLPVLRNFVLPGGSEVASHLQYARVLTRRAEREVVSLGERELVKPQILTYLNRLSDYLYMLARQVNYQEGIKEELWRGRK